MLNRNIDTMTITGPCDLSEKNIFAGTPMTLTVNGYKKAVKTDRLAGLSFNNYNDYTNDVAGGELFADSGKVNVVKIADVTIDKDVFNSPMDVHASVTFTIETASTTAGTAVVTLDSVAGSSVTIGANKTTSEVAALLSAGAPTGWTGKAVGANVTFTKVAASAMTSTSTTNNAVAFTTTEATASSANVTQFVAMGAEVLVYPYDSSKTYLVNDAIYVDASGLLTNDVSAAEADKKNLVGYVKYPPTSTISAMTLVINIA